MRGHRRVGALSALLVLPLLGGVAAGAVTPGTTGPGLVAVGPVSATDGFPVWYKDANGLRLMNCVTAADPLCPARGPLPDETANVSFPGNYPDEGFYMLANSSISTARAGKATADIALEQAFRNGPVTAGDQITFSRVRFKITNATDGVDYKITSPAGVKTLQTAAKTPGLLFDTEDIGIGGAGDFTGALGGSVGPFLTWDTYPTDPALKPVSVAGAPAADTYIGDGATPHKITGSPFGSNIFRIEGPGINPNPTVDACPTVAGPTADCVENDLFTLQGKLATTSGVTAEQATYSRTSAGSGLVDVFATSEASPQSIQVTDANPSAAAREFSATGLTGSAGHYFARVAYTGAQPPASVQVSNVGDVPVSNKVINVVDQVAGTATYDTSTSQLTVNAVSSDTVGPRTLTAVGYGDLSGGSLAVAALAAPPVSVTVKSDGGGSSSIPVTITGAARAPLPVMAAAGPNQTVVPNQLVTLDGSASSGDVQTYSWTSPPGINLTGPTSAKPTFTAPATPGDYTFALTVTGVGGPSTASVTVTVTAAAPLSANAGPNQTGVQRGTTVTLDGSASAGAATYQWAQLIGANDPVATLAGANTAKPTFSFPLYKYPAANGALMFQLTVTDATGKKSQTQKVKITPKADVVAVSAARYTASKKEWRVDGTSSILAGQRVTAHVGGLAGPVVGSAIVDVTGAFSIRSTPGFAAANGQTVSVESALGGTATGAAVRVG
ncbi:MAG: hypothetical protein QOI54_137 [Actinomycetota bacterium]|nr:hypothetical protein [Actinomycetota bacterium]